VLCMHTRQKVSNEKTKQPVASSKTIVTI
jgi:hypothetical protein